MSSGDVAQSEQFEQMAWLVVIGHSGCCGEGDVGSILQKVWSVWRTTNKYPLWL